MNQINSETPAAYTTQPLQLSSDDTMIEKALSVLTSRIKRGVCLNQPIDVINYLQLKTSNLEQEVFSILTLDNKHRVINFHSLFFGSISSASVYPREVVKTALADNAAAVVLSHNHPSGDSSPSQADKHITERITAALELVDIRTLDHIITGDTPTSFADRGLM